jgi:hypothetical protein
MEMSDGRLVSRRTRVAWTPRSAWIMSLRSEMRRLSSAVRVSDLGTSCDIS